jgi:dipeptidyl aminopeptidase/acylaminoacyl peptidase
VKPADIAHLVSLSTPTIHPSGSFAIYASSRPDTESDRYVGQLWRHDLAPPRRPSKRHRAERDEQTSARPQAPRRITRGIADSAPCLSPDGSVLAFLRADGKGRTQIHLLDPTGGEALQVTDAPLGVGSFRFSPDGRTIAYLARVPEPGRYGTVEGLGADAEAPRRITRLRWHANGVGYTQDRPAQVFALAAPGLGEEPEYPAAPSAAEDAAQGTTVPAARALTAGLHHHTALAFSADGSSVLAVRAPSADTQDLRTSLVKVGTDGTAEPAEADLVLTPEDGFEIRAVTALADGTIALLAGTPGEDGRDTVAPDVGLWLLEESGPRRLTDPETCDVGSAGGPGGEIVTSGEDVLLPVTERGRVHVIRVSRDGEVAPVLDGDLEVHGIAAARVGKQEIVLASAGTPDSFGEILRVGPDGTALPLTDHGAELRGSGLAVPEELELTGRDGYPVHGWLALPEGEGPFPLVLMIHGGPFAQYGVSVFDEVQTLVDAGIGVVFGNPRGSAGYGRSHGRSIKGAMGTLDAADVIDLLEGAIAGADGRVDSERLGIMGGSYGGYLTAWTIAHDHRFRAAIVERGFLDPASFAGTSDIGIYFGDNYVGTSPQDIVRQSPFAHVDQVRTPTLVIHSEQDYRCPLEQGTRYYSALRRQGIEAEMLIFPGENHELTRAGRPRHRIQRFEAVLEWWQRALG